MNKCLINEVLDHTAPNAALMWPGEVTDCEGLIDPVVWNDVPAHERRFVFGRLVSKLVAQGKLPLEFAGLSRARHNLYRKIKV